MRWTGIALGGLVLVLLLVLAFMDWNLLKHPIERTVGAKFGRTVTIAGDLKVHIWSATPTVNVTGLTLGNPPWEANRPMAKIERLEIQLKLLPLLEGEVVLPRVLVVKPDVYLHQEKSGRANWTFENKAPTNEPSSKPTKLPVMRDLIIQSGKLTLVDEIRRLKVNGTVAAGEKASQQDAKPFRIDGQGTINDQPFQLKIAGGPLMNLQPEHPYPFDLHILAGNIQVESDGRVLKPFSLEDLDFNVTLSGEDLAEGFYLTQLALPNTPPFKLHVHIERHGMRVGVSDIAGKVGGSDLEGRLDIDATRKRPSVRGDLIATRLRLKDLAATFGGRTKTEDSLENKPGATERRNRPQPKEKAPPPNPNARLFPDSHLQVERVRAMDGDVSFRAKSIEAGSLPMKEVALRVKLDNGLLAVDPFALEMPQGRLTGDATIDARKDVPRVHIDVRVKDIRLDHLLKAKSPDAQPPLSGVMEARAVIDGRGDSIHRVMSDANGKLTVVLPNGEVRSAFAELTGINVAKGIGLLLTKPQDSAEIRCGVAQFNIRDGLMNAENLTFDTQNVLIRGKGDIKLGPEELNLEIKGEPKKPRLTRLRTPIEVKGHLLKPSFGVDVGSTAKQGAIAAALGAIATPFAAVLAFVDPGLAKDQNCAQLLAEAEKNGPPPPKPSQSAMKSEAKSPQTNNTKLR